MPKPVVNGTEARNNNVMSCHFNEQLSLYGEQVVINLINQTKYEGELEKEFRRYAFN